MTASLKALSRLLVLGLACLTLGGAPRDGLADTLSSLARPRAERISGCISEWSDARVEVTGTVAQAREALAYVLAQPELGPAAVASVVDRLSPSSAQAFLIGLAGTDRGGHPWSRARAKDALTALNAPLWHDGLDEQVERGLVGLESLHELNGLRILDMACLPVAKRYAVRHARLCVPAPNPGQKLQKIIKLKDLEKYLSGEYQPTVGGAVASYEQVAFLRTPSELIAGLRLDYPKGFAGESEVGALVFPRPAEIRLIVPFDALLGGSPKTELVYPFTGTGFTATVGGRLVPELSVLSSERLPLPAGTELYQVSGNGARLLRGRLAADGKWLVP